MRVIAIAVLALFATAAFAGVTPPGVENPKVTLAVTQKAAADKRNAARDVCLTKPVAERSACRDAFNAQRKEDLADAQTAYEAALPVWRSAKAKATAAYKKEAASCKKLPTAERTPCLAANDEIYSVR
jgi:hypothetical protein